MPTNHKQHQNAGRAPEGSRDRVISFKTLDEKANWLDANASLDALRGGVQNTAKRFLAQKDADLRTRSIHRFVRDVIHYEQDWRISQGQPGEEFADSETILRRGYDDCDGKSRLFVALMRAAEILDPLGTGARIRPVFKGGHVLEFVHVQAEIMFPGSSRIEPNDNGWVLAELILKGCELGENPDNCPRGPRGERVLA